MKFDNVPDLYFVISVFVPGFIYHAVLSKFVPLHQQSVKELLFLGFFTSTAFNYALCSPIIYLLVNKQLYPDSPRLQALFWLIIIFISPIALAIISAFFKQHDGLRWLYRLLHLRAINPVPTGWDWIFSRTEPCFVLVTLGNGTQIAGYFGPVSMASSDPDRRDLFLERVYTIPRNQQVPWKLVDRTGGVYIAGASIALVEFRKEVFNG
jgi:Family of unknown function (DUF6338)